MFSGVTKLGVTWCSNWWCHPIFSSKQWRLLNSHRPLESDDLFLLLHCRHSRPLRLPASFVQCSAPRGAGALPFPLVPSLPRLLLYLPFFFLVGFNYLLLLSIPFLSTRIVPLRFQARGYRKRPNLGLVCCVYFVICIP